MNLEKKPRQSTDLAEYDFIVPKNFIELQAGFGKRHGVAAPTPSPVGVAVGVAAKKAPLFVACIRLQLYPVAAVSGCSWCCNCISPTPQKALIVSRCVVSGCRKNPPCCNCIRLQLYRLQLQHDRVSNCISIISAVCRTPP